LLLLLLLFYTGITVKLITVVLFSVEFN